MMRFLSMFARGAIAINKSMTAIGLTAVVALGIYDLLKSRQDYDRAKKR